MSSTIVNFYDHLPARYQQRGTSYPNYDKVKISLPNRFLIVAPSGSGKTNLTLNLIFLMNAWTKIYLFAKCYETEPLWQFFIDTIRDAEAKLSKKLKKPVEILKVASDDLADLPEIEEFDPLESNLVILDDFIGESNKTKLKALNEIWIRGRKQNISAMYLSQNYFEVSKTIRKNTGILILKDLGTMRDLRTILSEIAKDKTVEELKAMFKASEPEKMENFFLIDTSTGVNAGLRYRRNFEPFA